MKKSAHHTHRLDTRSFMLLLIAVAFSTLACATAARYTPADAAGNQCENQCVTILRSCETAGGANNSVCREDLSRCRNNCYEYHGGTFTPSGSAFNSQQPVSKEPPSATANETPAAAPRQPSATSQQVSAQPASLEQRLKDLESLFQSGHITEEEYREKRTAILSEL